MKNSISIVTAAFNECPGIISLVNHWLVFGENHPAIEAIEVIVCDDFSAMEQYDMLRQAFENNPQVTILRNEQNEGPGFSFARAIAQASHQWTLITDSDGQFPIENLDVMLPELWSSDASIAFTYRSRKFDNWINRFGQKASNKLCNAIYGSGLHDFSCAFKLVDTNLLKQLHFDARYMNYSLDHSGKLLETGRNFQEFEVKCSPAPARKRPLKAEYLRARNRLFYIVFLFFSVYLRKKRVIF
ncbi:MAG: glycosyltransferase family 2 protein [Bacteroidota bacterium]|mgnify:CR=1 FL=1